MSFILNGYLYQPPPFKGIEFKKIEARHSTRMDMLRWQHTEDAEIPWGGP
jgi:hypothetical protein